MSSYIAKFSDLIKLNTLSKKLEFIQQQPGLESLGISYFAKKTLLKYIGGSEFISPKPIQAKISLEDIFELSISQFNKLGLNQSHKNNKNLKVIIKNLYLGEEPVGYIYLKIEREFQKNHENKIESILYLAEHFDGFLSSKHSTFKSKQQGRVLSNKLLEIESLIDLTEIIYNQNDNVEGLFEKFDEFARLHQLTPLKTNGDQYIAVGFSAHPKHILPSSFNTNIHQRASLKESLCRSVRDAVSAAFHFACKARDEVNSHPLLVSSSCYLRVGIATGPVIAGRSSRRLGNFDIWGATVNRAAMLEQFTAPNTIAMCDRSGSLLISPEHNRPLLHGNHLLLYPKYLKTKAEGILAHIC